MRAYAVGAAFSVKDVEDQFAWRRVGFAGDDYNYRRATPRPQPTSDNGRRARRTVAPVTRKIDPSRIRTPEQRRAAALRVVNG